MAEDTKELTQQPKTLKFQAPKEIEVLNASLGGVPGVDYSRMAKEVKTPEQVAVAEGELYKQMEPQRQRIAEMESEKARVDTANKAMLAEAEAEKVYSTENQRKRIYDENPYPKLNPTKENVQSLATLFSLIGVVGFGLGGRGKMSAMNSLNAMTGLMKGWQQGRSDLFKKDLQEFEKNMTSVKAILDAADREADRIYKLLPVDRAKAETEMAALTASLGGQILKQKTQLQGVEQGISYIKDLSKTMNDAYDRAFKEKKEAREAAHAKEMERLKEKEIDVSEKLRRAQIAATKEAKLSRAATDRFGFGDIVATASNEAAASLKNLVEMPSDVTSGIFGGRRTTSLFTAPLDTLVNTAVTSEDTQRYNTEINNLGKFIAQVQKGGRVVTNADIETTSQAFRIEEGDKPLTKLTKLAQARQALERALEVRIASPNTPEQLKQVYRQNQDDIRVAVPFTVSDVNKFANERDKNKTFTQSFETDGIKGPAVGTVKNGYEFKGGDPSKPENWTKVK